MRDGLGTPRRVVLLGGTSEIGLAIVRRLFDGRHGEVVLAGRAGPRRDAAVQAMRDAGLDVRWVDFDARATEDHETVITSAFAEGDVDVAIVAFGVLGDEAAALRDPHVAVEVATTNYVGAVSVGVLLAERFRQQGHGAILALSSVSAERARRANFVYGSSKAGLDAFYSGLADELHGSGVWVTVLRPGFVHTRMTVGRRPAPFAVDADRVAEVAVLALHARRPVAWAPGKLRWMMAVLRHLPRLLFRHIAR